MASQSPVGKLTKVALVFPEVKTKSDPVELSVVEREKLWKFVSVRHDSKITILSIFFLEMCSFSRLCIPTFPAAPGSSLVRGRKAT